MNATRLTLSMSAVLLARADPYFIHSKHFA